MRGCSSSRHGNAALALWLGALVVSAPVLASAQADPATGSDAGSDAPPVQDAAPPVSLDTLLKLPAGTPATPEPRTGGATRAEWAERFRAARADVASAEAALAEAQAKLESMATGSDAWQVTAPGAPAGSESGPLSFGLRQEIRRQREEVERAQRRLEDLRVEANLAGVPEAWTAAPVAPSAGAPATP